MSDTPDPSLTVQPAALDLHVGMTLYGAHEERLVVQAIDDDAVTLLRPTTLAEVTMTPDEVGAFASGSARRSYPVDAAGERRVKLCVEQRAGERWVGYATPEATGNLVHWAEAADWRAWRAGLER